MGSGQSKSTVVANAFLFDIYVKCEGDSEFKSEVSTETYSLELNKLVAEYTRQHATERNDNLKASFMKISSGYSQEFHPNSSERVYLSIIYPDNDNSWKVICCMHPIPENCGVIVVKEGSVTLAKHKSSRWIDKDGCNHLLYAEKLVKFKTKVVEIKKRHRRELSDVRKEYEIKKADD